MWFVTFAIMYKRKKEVVVLGKLGRRGHSERKVNVSGKHPPNETYENNYFLVAEFKPMTSYSV